MPRHPHAYTLELLRLAIEKLPPTFPEESRQRYRQLLDGFLANPAVPYAMIHDSIVRLGRESWAYRRAYEDMYRQYGRSSEEAHLLENLDAGIREKYERFIHEGGKINDLEEGKGPAVPGKSAPFERFFNPEEKFAIGQALLMARDQARQEINDLVTNQRQAEYQASVGLFGEEQKHLEAILNELRALADVSHKWQPEIMDRLSTLEEGWSVVEKPITVPDAVEEVDYWKGTLESFLQAA